MSLDGLRNGLDRFNGHRRVLGNPLGVVIDIGGQHMRREHTVDQPHFPGLVSAELAGGEEDFLDHRRPDQIGKAADTLIAIAKAELCRRDGEPALVLAQPQVTGHGKPHAAADAKSLDHRDGRLREIEHRIIEGLAGVGIFADILGAGPLLLEFRDIRARGKSLAAGPANHKKPCLGIGRHAVHLGSACLVHGKRDGVMPLGIVDHHMADPVDDAGKKLALGMFGQLIEFHVTPRDSKSAISASE